MASYNHVTLVGNLTKDVELRNTPRGATVGNMSLAVNRTWFDKQANEKKEECSFFDVVMFGKTAEIAAEYLAKGRSCLVAGYLKQERWEDKQSGAQRSKVVVVCDTLQFLGGKDGGGARSRGEESDADRNAANYYKKPDEYFPPEGQTPTANSLDDDVPF